MTDACGQQARHRHRVWLRIVHRVIRAWVLVCLVLGPRNLCGYRVTCAKDECHEHQEM